MPMTERTITGEPYRVERCPRAACPAAVTSGPAE